MIASIYDCFGCYLNGTKTPATRVALDWLQVSELIRILIVTTRKHSVHGGNQNGLFLARVLLVLAQEFNERLRGLIVENELKVNDEVRGNKELKRDHYEYVKQMGHECVAL